MTAVAEPSVWGGAAAEAEHPCCARLLALPRDTCPLWNRKVERQLEGLGLAAGLVRLDDGGAWLLLQPELEPQIGSVLLPGGDLQSVVLAQLLEAVGLLCPVLESSAPCLRPLHGYFLELFGWAEVPALRLAFSPALREDLPEFCPTLESLQAYRLQPALPAWRRPRAIVRWLSRASRIVCDPAPPAVPRAELLAWVELRLEALAAERVDLPLVVHVVGQLGQRLEPMELHALGVELYASYCAVRSMEVRLGVADLQMRAAHDHAPPRCRRCDAPEAVCARRRGRGPCVCAACGGLMALQLRPSELLPHIDNTACRAAARSALSRTLELLSWREDVERFDQASFHRWLQAPRPCCAFRGGGDLLGACGSCLERFCRSQKLQGLRLQPPDWGALEDEQQHARALLAEPPLVQGGWVCATCSRPRGGYCEAALRCHAEPV